MRPRAAFTLIELMVALVVTSLVVTLAYAALQAGFDTESRLTAHRGTSESAVTVRALLSDALRHTAQGIRGGPSVFQLVDRRTADGLPSDSLVFVTRGIEPPYGSSESWKVMLSHHDGRITLIAVPMEALRGLQPLRATLDGVAGLDIHALGRASFVSWSGAWNDVDVAPEAVRVSFSGDGRESLGVPLVVRVGLERTP